MGLHLGSILKKIDFNTLFPIIQKLAGDKKIGGVSVKQAANIYLQVIKPIIQAAKEVEKKKKDDNPLSTSPANPNIPSDVHTQPAGTPTPSAPPPASTQGAHAMKITRIRNAEHNGVFFLKEWQDGKPGSGDVSKKERLDAVLSGNDPIGKGAAIHYNFSPVDENGQEIGPDDPRHAAVNSGAAYIGLQVEFNGETETVRPTQDGSTLDCGLEVHSMSDDFGCTPVLKVPADFSGGNNNTVRVRAFLTTDESVMGDWTTPVRIAD